MDSTQFLTVAEAAEALGISRSALWERIERRTFPAVPIGKRSDGRHFWRVKQSDLASYLRKRREKKEGRPLSETPLAGHPVTALVEDYIADCEAGGLRPNTIRLYRRYLAEFVAYLDSIGAQEIHARSIRAFIAGLGDSHTPAGVHTYWRTIKTFCRFLLREEVLDRNPFDRLRTPRLDWSPKDPLSLDDFAALLSACGDDMLGLRDKSLLLALLDSGMRSGEAVALNVGDVDLTTGKVAIRTSKSRRGRTVFIGAETRAALAVYLATREVPGLGEPLWMSCHAGWVQANLVRGVVHDGRLTYAGLRMVIRRRAALAGIPTPPMHAFRRGFAVQMHANGADLLSISRMMGHASLPLLERYIR
jgi:excisionase family DNA binding protein